MLSTLGFACALVVAIGVPIVLLILVSAAAPFTGAAIDSFDDNILEPADRATLNGIGSSMGLVLLAGTVLGVTAIALGLLTRRASEFAVPTIALASVAPVLCLFISFWTLAAAGAPDYTPG